MPRSGEFMVKGSGGADKFVNSNLDAGLSAEEALNELYAVWHIAKGGPVDLTSNATVMRSDWISFGV
jgi:hypothetical protein